MAQPVCKSQFLKRVVVDYCNNDNNVGNDDNLYVACLYLQELTNIDLSRIWSCECSQAQHANEQANF